MQRYPMELGNIVLILVGIALIASGPIICYRTVKGVIEIRKKDPRASLHPISNAVNLLIGVLFFYAGIHFVLNNLRGNPLA